MQKKKTQPVNDKLLIGEYLKQERERKGISLEYISSQTKINYNVLKNLENDNLHELPNIAYLKGFVQHYSKIIEGDLDKSIETLEYSYGLKNKNYQENKAEYEYELQIKPSTPKAIGNTTEESVGDKIVTGYNKIIENRKPILISIIGLVAAFSIYNAFTYINSNIENAKKIRQEKAELEGTEQPTEPVIAAETKEEPTTPVVEATKVPEKKVEPKVEVVAAKVEPKVEVKKVEKKAANTKNKYSEKFPFAKFKKFGKFKSFNILENAKENSDGLILTSEVKDKLQDDKQNVYISAVTEKTWISYMVDNGPVEAKVLRPGQNLFLQGEEIALFIGNVNATKIFYNNNLIDALSKNGVKSLVFPEDRMSNYYQPLFKTNADGVLYKSSEYIDNMMPENLETKTN